ncbi:muscle M-line assembly protein unc-89-like [Syngnathus scovelli]|uniref:muscle M-line assembly protein unc-89-like n=1 Tax=Syngnathus scovelli TaxID=161590 RepID=UPI0021100771|nr:uncharacterized protein LOC125969137 [Syngnathus scovelli]
MNFSKLLCLVLVYSQQLRQVLANETPECEGKTDGNTVPCNGKKGGALKLKVTGGLSNTETVAKWQKGTGDIATDNKYTMAGKDLTIKTLDVPDEGEYTAKNVSPEEKFQVKVVDCLGSKTSTPAVCKGKKGDSIKLGLSDGTVSSISWKKGTEKITANTTKYPGGVTEATLTINNLDDKDEAKFTGGANGEGESFSVQVAPVCLSSDASCVGKLSRDLVLKVEGPVTGKVTWEKDDTPLTDQRYVKSGTNEKELMIPNLVAPDAGTYKAKYGANTVPFTVSIPEPKASDGTTKKPAPGGGTTKKPATMGGGGGGNTTDTVVVHDKNPGGGGGSGSVLSYSPALLVTVTLVHLLLQLAA